MSQKNLGQPRFRVKYIKKVLPSFLFAITERYYVKVLKLIIDIYRVKYFHTIAHA